jgi:hypothetical protein
LIGVHAPLLHQFTEDVEARVWGKRRTAICIPGFREGGEGRGGRGQREGKHTRITTTTAPPPPPPPLPPPLSHTPTSHLSEGPEATVGHLVRDAFRRRGDALRLVPLVQRGELGGVDIGKAI